MLLLLCRIAQDIFWSLEKNGYIARDSVEQLLCEKCNRYHIIFYIKVSLIIITTSNNTVDLIVLKALFRRGIFEIVNHHKFHRKLQPRKWRGLHSLPDE